MQTNNRQLQSTVLLTLCLMVPLLGGCRGRGGPPEEVAVTAIPTATAVTVSAIATFTPTNVPDTPTPVPTQTPIPPPTAVPTVEDKRATVNSQYGVNLRAGPGTIYATVGFLEQGAKVTAIAQTRDTRWIQLENGWVFHNLLDGIPADLPLPRSIPSPPTPTPLPPTATATPAPSTPTPVPTSTPKLGDFDNPYPYKSKQLLPDGLSIRLMETIYDDEDAMSNYIEPVFGRSCLDCLALELEIRNEKGDNEEYVVQEDFELLKGDRDTTVQRETCKRVLPEESVTLNKKWKFLLQRAQVSRNVHLCFRGIEGSKSEMEETYRLAYTADSWIAPTPTPTLTPEGALVSRKSEITEETTGETRYFWLGPEPE